MAASSKVETSTPEAQLRDLLGKFDAKEQKLIRSVRSALRKRFPTANELIYDYRSFFLIGYSPSDHGIESIVSLAARPDGLRLYLTQGPKLPDPKKLLVGSAKQVRYVPLESARKLAHPDIEALIAAAIELAPVKLPAKGAGKLLTKTSAAKAPARRKAAKK
jgi:hypothetical protein